MTNINTSVSRWKQVYDKSKIATCFFSILLATNLTFGREIYHSNGIDRFFTDVAFVIRTIVITLLLAILIYFIIEKLILNRIINTQIKQLNNTVKRSDIFFKQYILIWVCVFVAWLPAFFAYYPGILSYDTQTQTAIALGILPNSRFHPPLHTFIWQACILFEKGTGIQALICYSILQMLILSAALSYLLFVILKENSGKVLFVVSFIFITLNPVIAIMSIVVTKDVLFAAALSILLIQLFYMEKSPDRYFSDSKNYIIAILSCVLSGLLRNNAIYALFLSSIVLLILKKKYRKEILSISLISIGLIILINGPVYDAMKITKGNPREMLSVPIQQIARAVDNNSNTISDDEKNVIDNYLQYDSLGEQYNPRFADPVKNTFNRDYFQNDKIDFLKLWFHLFCKYPMDYINASLDLNIPYWYIGASTLDPYSERAYIETNNYELYYYPVERHSFNPVLLKWYESFATFSALSHIPVFFSLPFSIATPIWLMLLCVTLLIRQRRSKYVSCFLPYLFLWLTHLAGPVSNFRYIFPIYVVYPFFVFITLHKIDENICVK